MASLPQSRLGHAGPEVSRLGMGCVELGLDYGLPGEADTQRPPEDAAVELVRSACDAGITFFDTARSYGRSELLLGEALADTPDACVATKAHLEGLQGEEAAKALTASIQESRERLGRDTIDVLKIHNATRGILEDAAVLAALDAAREDGWIEHAGASVYGREAALAAIENEAIDVLQIAFSAMDRRFATEVLPRAEEAGMGVVARSVLLKGVLTPKAKQLPDALEPLAGAAQDAREAFGCSWAELPAYAIRYAMSQDGIDTVLVGMRNRRELETAVEAARGGPLDDTTRNAIESIQVDPERLLNPSTWPS